MTKEKIIDLLYNEIGNPDYKTVGDYHKGIADKLLSLIEQEKKEVARDILEDISKEIKVKEDIYGREYHIVYEEGVLRLMKKLKDKYGVEL